MKIKSKKIIISAILICVLIAVVILLYGTGYNNSVQYQFVELKKGNIESTISSTGTLNPVTEIVVGTQVSGTIEQIFVDFNDQVKKGQIVAVLDSALLRMSVNEAQANVLKAEAQLEEAQANYERSQMLSYKKLLANSEFQSVKTLLKTAQASMISAKIALERAQQNLKYAIIRAPISGTVTARNIEEGQTVAASFSTPTLFTIAQDLSKMEIKASVDESDIGQIKRGQNVRFTVQAYSDRKFEGRVKQVRVQPTTTANVVNYTVVISAENKENLLLPGMTATIDFVVDRKENILMVPNSVLRFQPSEKELAEVQKRMEPSMKGPSQMPPPDNFEGEWKRMWVLDNDGKLLAFPVLVGLSDGSNTEVIGDHFSAGMKVISGSESAGPRTNSSKSKSNSDGPPPPPMM